MAPHMTPHMADKKHPAIWLIKRDFRLADNAALAAAQRHQTVVPLWIIDPSVARSDDASHCHLIAQLSAAAHLQTELRKRGSNLYIAIADSVELLSRLHREISFSAIYSHQETGSRKTYDRDRAIINWCKCHDVSWTETYQTGVIRGPHPRFERPEILSQRLLQTTAIPIPDHLPPSPSPAALAKLSSEQFSTTLPDADALPSCLEGISTTSLMKVEQLQEINEEAALADLDSFLRHRGVGYLDGISSPNDAFACGSRLSAHLAWGTLSLRTVFAKKHHREKELKNQSDTSSLRWSKSLNAFQSRLYWHDHFVQRFESDCDMEFQPLNPAYADLQYPSSGENLQRWLEGKTGIPLVDASIRCVQTCGFLNFRMRAMLVSVACYGLGLHWRDIQYPLARWFYDYEPGIHFSQIQMQAGVVGINTIRVYNPHKQLLEHDGKCKFVKQWLPELRDFSAEDIANYQTCPLGNYPPPPENLEETAALMKRRIFEIRQSDAGKRESAKILEAFGSRRPSNKRPKTRPRSPSKWLYSAPDVDSKTGPEDASNPKSNADQRVQLTLDL